MRAWIRHHKIEVKYLVIGIVLLGTLITLDRTHVLGNLDHAVIDVLDASEGLGAVGGYKELAKYTTLGGSLFVFALPDAVNAQRTAKD